MEPQEYLLLAIDTVYQPYLRFEETLISFSDYFFTDFYRRFFADRYHADSFEAEKPYGIQWLTKDVIFWIRFGMFAFNYLVFSMPQLYRYTFDKNFVYFTSWSVHLTTLSLLLSMWSSNNDGAVVSNYKTGAMVLTAAAQYINVIVTTESWGLIIPSYV